MRIIGATLRSPETPVVPDDPRKKWAAMREHTGESRCERCSREFHCGANDMQPCWCATQFPSALNGREAVSGCLCPDCLRAAIAARGAI
jgi:Cysteine-rich CWC